MLGPKIIFVIQLFCVIVVHVDCFIDQYCSAEWFKALFNANDLALFAPTPNCMQKVLDVCESYAVEYNILNCDQYMLHLCIKRVCAYMNIIQSS